MSINPMPFTIKDGTVAQSIHEHFSNETLQQVMFYCDDRTKQQLACVNSLFRVLTVQTAEIQAKDDLLCSGFLLISKLQKNESSEGKNLRESLNTHFEPSSTSLKQIQKRSTAFLDNIISIAHVTPTAPKSSFTLSMLASELASGQHFDLAVYISKKALETINENANSVSAIKNHSIEMFYHYQAVDILAKAHQIAKAQDIISSINNSLFKVYALAIINDVTAIQLIIFDNQKIKNQLRLQAVEGFLAGGHTHHAELMRDSIEDERSKNEANYKIRTFARKQLEDLP